MCQLAFIKLRDFERRVWYMQVALSCSVFLGSRLARLDDHFAFCSKLIPQSSEPSFFYRNCLFFFSTIFSKYGLLPDDKAHLLPSL